ncbi:esterase [Actinorhabdospora filicis]|uniref:Esterase n=1 Tax=Actinorhabdospora filicis TaxID=1785913 RepID=A0A9W6SNA8_9ACTN|nr:serine hydrolase domain-containing protein [Actinorhabdospora filicis]GLZ79032.1 esterase [Actinorhabdospora filicis]
MTISERVRPVLLAGVADRVHPGAVWAVGDAGGVIASGAEGVADPAAPEPIGLDAIFDLASLTKVLVVWTAIGRLWEAGRLALDDRLDAHLPETSGHPLGPVTPRQLLAHTAGLPHHAGFKANYGSDPAAIVRGVLTADLHQPPGTAVKYTDRAAFVLGVLAERLTATTLAELTRERVWEPLGMRETWFGPVPADLRGRCAPTELDPESGTHRRGEVHDFSTRLFGGACGISGVFSTAGDLGLFLAHLLRPDERLGFGSAWLAESLRTQTGGLDPARGLFWHPAHGTAPEEDVWTHPGFTGTAFWLCPKQGRWAVLLTNRVYWSRERLPIKAVRDGFRAAVFTG